MSVRQQHATDHAAAASQALRLLNAASTVLCLLVFATPSTATDKVALPLHRRIDQLIQQAAPDFEQRSGGGISDSQFLRRVSLDLTGRIPTASQRQDFLEDHQPDKRQRLIDRLLASPEHARHLQHHLDTMLMQRLPKKHVDLQVWQDYLYEAARHNKPWDVLTREILSADGVLAEQRAPARFLLDRELKAEESTRDLARVFLGRDLQCAQCHDHPNVGDYSQQHYFGIRAFLSRSYVFTDPKTKQASIGEKAEGVVTFMSVFGDTEMETAPRILDLPELTDPEPDPEPYVAKPEKTTRGIPKYSRRLLLAEAITDSDNRSYQLNIANRLWAFVMGRGLVEPLDMIHSDNPPSHPNVLNLLADDLAANCYDMRRTIRELVLTKAYQRTSRADDAESAASDRYYVSPLKPLTPEQLAWSVMQASGMIARARSEAIEKLQQDQKESPDSDAPRQPEQDSFRLEQRINESLSPHVATFVSIFAPANDTGRFDATAKQALFLLNDPKVGEWLSNGDGSLVARLAKGDELGAVADELFLCVMTREPTEEERQAIITFLQDAGDHRASAIKQLARSLISSSEFRFNH